MATKKTTKQATPPRNKQATPDVEKKDPKPEEDDRPFTVTSWHGLPLYQCKQCPYNDLKVSNTISHAMSKHGPKREPTGLVTPDGKPVTKEV